MSLKRTRPFEFEDGVVNIADIDKDNVTCRLGFPVGSESLIASIQAVGVVNPPVLRRQDHLSYHIVCGFRRIMACEALGWNQLDARIIRGNPTELEILKLAIHDNRSHRHLNAVEQAIGIQRLSAHIPARGRLQALSSLLGFPENRKVLKRLEALAQLPIPIQQGVLNETVSLELVFQLAQFTHEDALSFFEIFELLQLSQSKQREVMLLVKEIAIREDRNPGDIVRCKEIGDILQRAELNRNEKASLIRAYLKGCRYPALSSAEQGFSEALKDLKLGEHIRLAAPPHFEAGPYTLRLTFKTMRDFQEGLKKLNSTAKNPALKRLFEPFE